MQKKWFRDLALLFVPVLFVVFLNLGIQPINAYTQISTDNGMICCGNSGVPGAPTVPQDYLPCLESQAKATLNPTTQQYFTSYAAAKTYDTQHNTNYFTITIAGKCYSLAKCFPRTETNCDSSAPPLCLTDAQCNGGGTNESLYTKYCDKKALPNACNNKKPNGNGCTSSSQCLSNNCETGDFGSGKFCKAATCSTWSYTAWTTCFNGSQSRMILPNPPPQPLGCVGGVTEPLQRACGPTVTCTSFTYSAWGTCTAAKQTRTATGSPDGCKDGNPVLQQACGPTAVPCSEWTYSDWTACTNGTRTRTATPKTPAGCVGETTEALSEACGAGVPACVSWTYGNWSACTKGVHTRTKKSEPKTCSGGVAPGPTTEKCSMPCTSYEYTDWQPCDKGVNKRELSKSIPAGCAGGATQEPLEKSCASEPASCGKTCAEGSFCDGTSCVAKKALGSACSGPFQCADGFCYGAVCSGPAGSDCPTFKTSGTCPSSICTWQSNACSSKPGYGEQCNGSGPTFCKEGSCITDDGKSICRKTCTGTDCPDGNFCYESSDGNYCKAKLAAGGTCKAASDCASDVCTASKCVGGAVSGAGGDGGGGGEDAPASEFAIPNFLGITDPNLLIGRIIKYIIGFAGTIALVSFMYGGAMWLISAGRMDYVSKGKNYMIWAAIGLAVVFGAYILLDQVLTLFGK